MSVDTGTYSRGLEGIIADETTICRIDGQKGKLFYRGYSIEELAKHSDFEEVACLLLYEKLPTAAELAEWRTRMRRSRDIPAQVLQMIRAFPAGAHPMQLLHAEHEFNASTFTACVVASTMSTCYCSISAAMGALFGSLHGGANEKVLDMVEQIGAKDKVSGWMDRAIAEKRKIMGMGHREYKVKDPRSYVMEEKGKPLYPNVDFFSGAVYTLRGIPKILFTPVFAMARVSGWLAHVLEQRERG